VSKILSAPAVGQFSVGGNTLSPLASQTAMSPLENEQINRGSGQELPKRWCKEVLAGLNGQVLPTLAVSIHSNGQKLPSQQSFLIGVGRKCPPSDGSSVSMGNSCPSVFVCGQKMPKKRRAML